jgi:hypothetical protein
VKQRLGAHPLHVMVDERYYRAALTGTVRKLPATMEHVLFHPSTTGGWWKRLLHRARVGPPPEQARPAEEWHFPLVSGDHDLAVAQGIVQSYYSGKLRALAAPDQLAACTEFEARFLKRFPHEYPGEQPRPEGAVQGTPNE